MYPQQDQFPTNIRNQLTHAQNFSDVIHGAALLYNLMLAEKGVGIGPDRFRFHGDGAHRGQRPGDQRCVGFGPVPGYRRARFRQRSGLARLPGADARDGARGEGVRPTKKRDILVKGMKELNFLPADGSGP